MNDLFKLYEQKLDKPKGTALPSLLHLLGMKFRYPLITSSAAFATFSGVKPNARKSSPAGAEAPKWSRDTVLPSRPT